MKKIRTVLDRVLSILCAAIFSFMTLLAVYQVVMRYVFEKPSSFSEELLTYSFVWMGMLAAALIFGERDHMRLSFFAGKLKGKSVVVLEIVTELLILIFSAVVLIHGGISITTLTMKQITASLPGVHMGYIYTIMPISGVLIVVYNLLNLADLVPQLLKTSQERQALETDQTPE